MSAMPRSPHSPNETRHDQTFPVLEAAEIARITRLGERRAYPAGAHIFTAGEVAPGAFMGELAQLSGRPALVDGVATEPVEALVIPPRRLRDLLVEEAELGERIM